MSNGHLADRHCVPCAGGVPRLAREEIAALLGQLGGMWRVVDDHHLEKDFELLDFEQALALVARVGQLALREGHYPDLQVRDDTVTISIFTHKVDGLTESDFVLAAKIDQVY